MALEHTSLVPADATLAYDAYAPRYDDILKENRINAYMRKATSVALSSTFPTRSRLLEIGCGTGDEALALARRGAEVVALDPSDGMLRVARSKAESLGLENMVTFFRGAGSDLPRLRQVIPGVFNGAYASFSLAYEPDLRPFARGLDEFLSPGALFLASLPSRLCLVEFLLALPLGRPYYAGRRLRPLHGHKVGRYTVPVRTYTPRLLAREMGRHFVLERWKAVPAIVPPPYMNRFYSKLGGFPDALERADELLVDRGPFRSLGDHFLARFRHAPRPL